MRKGNKQLGNIKSFHTELPNSSAGDTQAAFPGMENDAGTKSRGKKGIPAEGKMLLWPKQDQVGASPGHGRNTSLTLWPSPPWAQRSPLCTQAPLREGEEDISC